jgi:hypothetical protein
LFDDSTGGIHSVQARHADIHDDHVRLVPSDDVNRFMPITTHNEKEGPSSTS